MPAKRRRIRYVSEKGAVKRQEKKQLIAQDKLFYLSIWDERSHICYECGISLGDQPLMYYFHHILEKGSSRYAHLRHDKDNIVLLCLGCHNRVTASLQAIPKTYQLYLQTLKHYGYTQEEDMGRGDNESPFHNCDSL